MTAITITSEVDHIGHDLKWNLSPTNSANPDFCLACMTELLENKDIAVVKKKFVVAEFLGILRDRSQHVVNLLADDSRVAVHICMVLLDLLNEEDGSFTSMAAEVIVQLVCQLKQEELLCCVIEALSSKTLKQCNYKRSIAVFHLIGRLLYNVPPLAAQLLHNFGPLIDYIVSGLVYPDECVQASVAFILAHLYNPEHAEIVPAQLSQQIAGNVLNILRTSQLQELQINVLGLLKKMLSHESVCKMYMAAQEDDRSLASGLRKIMLTRKDVLQISAVQCLASVLASDTGGQDTERLLEADVAEYLFEFLASNNDLLISSIFCCLALFARNDNFYKKCHVVYGIESILRGIDQCFKLRNPQNIIHGMSLLATVLERHPDGIRLFSSPSLVSICLDVITQGVQHNNHFIVQHATKALGNILRREHLPSPVPYKDIMKSIQCLVKNVQRSAKMQCKPTAKMDTRGQQKRDGASNMAIKSGKVQAQLESLMNVLECTSRLAMECFQDPAANVESFCGPLEQACAGEPRLKDLVAVLLYYMDECAVPFVMTNLPYITSCQLYTSFFSFLAVILTLAEKMDVYNGMMCIKMVAAGMISVALEIKGKFSSEDLSHSIDQYLTSTCSVLLCDAEPSVHLSECKSTLATGVRGLKGSLTDLVSVLSQHTDVCDDTTDQSYQAMQQTLIAIIYLEQFYGKSSVPQDILLESVALYLSLQQNFHISQTSLPTLKHVTYLTANCLSSANPTRSYSDTVDLLVEMLQKSASPESILLLCPAVLRWCFSDGRISRVCGKQMLCKWLKTIPDADEDELNLESQTKESINYQELSELIKSNHLCFETVLSVLASGQEDEVTKLVGIIERIISQGNSQSGDMDAFQNLKQVLSDVLQNIFLNGKTSRLDNSVCALLKIIISIQRRCLETVVTLDTKLYYHVISLIANTDSSKLTTRTAMNFMTLQLFQAGQQLDNQVASMALSNKKLLTVLEKKMRSKRTTSSLTALNLFSMLMKQQKQFDIKVEHQVKVDLGILLTLVKSDDITHNTIGLQWWTHFLEAPSKNDLVLIMGTEEVINDKNVKKYDVGITNTDLRVLIICAQQAVVKEHSLLQKFAVTCLVTAFQACHALDELLGKHVICIPWTKFLLANLLDSCESEVPQDHILKFAHYLIQNGGTHMMKQRHVEYCCKQFLDLEVSKIKSGLIDLIESVMEMCEDDVKNAPEINEKLKCCKCTPAVSDQNAEPSSQIMTCMLDGILVVVPPE